MWKQIAEGTGATSLVSLANYEDSIGEGEIGKLKLILSTPIPSNIVDELQAQLVSQGVEGVKVYEETSALSIEFTKGFPWLAVIAAAVLGLIVLAVLIVSWQLFREMAAVLPTPVIIAAAIAGIALVTVLVLILYKARIGG